jgi:hypothetical protein
MNLPAFCANRAIPTSSPDSRFDGWPTSVDGFNDKAFTSKISTHRGSSATYSIADDDGAPDAASIQF